MKIPAGAATANGDRNDAARTPAADETMAKKKAKKKSTSKKTSTDEDKKRKPYVRKTTEQKLKELEEKREKILAEQAEADRRAREKELAGPSARVMNVLGRNVRTLQKALDILIAQAGDKPDQQEKVALGVIKNRIATMRSQWQEGMKRNQEYAKQTGDRSRLKGIKELDIITEAEAA